METNFNFKSQICTDRNQSERLLKLGLKKETADMVHFISASMKEWGILATPWRDDYEGCKFYSPAWSLGRLLALVNGEGWRAEITLRDEMYGIYYGYESHWYDDIFEGVIDWIEDDIKSRYFNRKYLEE